MIRMEHKITISDDEDLSPQVSSLGDIVQKSLKTTRILIEVAENENTNSNDEIITASGDYDSKESGSKWSWVNSIVGNRGPDIVDSAVLRSDDSPAVKLPLGSDTVDTGQWKFEKNSNKDEIDNLRLSIGREGENITDSTDADYRNRCDPKSITDDYSKTITDDHKSNVDDNPKNITNNNDINRNIINTVQIRHEQAAYEMDLLYGEDSDDENNRKAYDAFSVSLWTSQQNTCLRNHGVSGGKPTNGRRRISEPFDQTAARDSQLQLPDSWDHVTFKDQAEGDIGWCFSCYPCCEKRLLKKGTVKTELRGRSISIYRRWLKKGTVKTELRGRSINVHISQVAQERYSQN